MSKIESSTVRCDMSCAILAATEDGDNLSSGELSIVQGAVNDRLSEEGWGKFWEIFDEYVRDDEQ